MILGDLGFGLLGLHGGLGTFHGQVDDVLTYLKMPRKLDTAQGVGTDLMRLTPYWAMDLTQLRAEASRRAFLGTTNVTKKFLVRWLIENDYPWWRC